MSKEVKSKAKTVKRETFESLRTLYFSGKVKPSLNKMIVELEIDPTNIDITLLACKCSLRSKSYDQLLTFADAAIKLDDKNPEGYYYKGMALHFANGKEQDSLKNFNEALTLDPENPIYLKGKSATHLLLFTNYDLPIKFAEKHRDKGADCLTKALAIIEQKENPDYIDLLTAAEISAIINKNLDAKRFFINAANFYESSEEELDKNLYKDIVKGQKACAKLIGKIIDPAM